MQLIHVKIIIHKLQIIHLFPLLQVGHHDDGGRVLLPDHPPEVINSFLLRPWEAKGSEVSISLIKMIMMIAINPVSSTDTSTNNTLSGNEFILLLVTLEK